MRVPALLAAISICLLAAAPAVAYDTLQEDYAACTQGGNQISSGEIVEACSRLIDNAQQENELVGYFYAMRAASNDDRAQNCADAHKVLELVTDKVFVDGAKQLIKDNC